MDGTPLTKNSEAGREEQGQSGADELSLGLVSVKYQWRQTLPEGSLLDGSGAEMVELGVISTHGAEVGAESWERVRSFKVNVWRSPGIKPARNWHF